MLVTDDDLKREIGEWVVTGLNKDKIINGLVAQATAMAARLEAQQVQIDSAVKVVASNTLFQTKNNELASTLTTERTKATADIKALEADLKAAETDMKGIKEDLSVAETSLKRCQETVDIEVGAKKACMVELESTTEKLISSDSKLKELRKTKKSKTRS